MRNGPRCWRCGLVDVRCYGVPCAECRRILEAEYDRLIAASGGKLLFIPDDWDGMTTIECEQCGSPFDAPFLGKPSIDRLCGECLTKNQAACAAAWRAANAPARSRERDPHRITVNGIC